MAIPYTVIDRRISSRDDEVQYLYEEMESQIRAEKERVLAEVYG